jgi:hypothetical protein
VGGGGSAAGARDELAVRSFSTLPSTDLDAPTPADISREWWGYLDPDSPTPAELSRARVKDIPADAKYLPGKFKLAAKHAADTEELTAAPAQEAKAAPGAEAESKMNFSRKYESNAMKALEAAASAARTPAAAVKPSAASVVLDGTIEHIQRDVLAKEELLKKLELEREHTAKALKHEKLKQGKIAKTQKWIKESMKNEDSSTADQIQALLKSQTGYDRKEQQLWGEIKQLFKRQSTLTDLKRDADAEARC